jgi:hypothetical protein
VGWMFDRFGCWLCCVMTLNARNRFRAVSAAVLCHVIDVAVGYLTELRLFRQNVRVLWFLRVLSESVGSKRCIRANQNRDESQREYYKQFHN